MDFQISIDYPAQQIKAVPQQWNFTMEFKNADTGGGMGRKCRQL